MMRPADPRQRPFELLVELILEQVKNALEIGGSDLDHMLKCNVLYISADRSRPSRRLQALLPKNAPASIVIGARVDRELEIEVVRVPVTKD